MMKTIALSLLFFIVSVTCETEPLLDSSGSEVREGVRYYMVSALFVKGPGVGISLGRHGPCPLDVIQTGRPGLPVTFSPVTFSPAQDQDKGKDGIIYESSNLNIKFPDYGIIWRLDDYDESAKCSFITITGENDGNNPETRVKSSFKIVKKFTGFYKIVHCPEDQSCNDVGFSGWKGARRLAIRDIPFYYKFDKVNDVQIQKGNNTIDVM